ncbi:MAG TPA: ABC transporter permease subunit [Hypericibacter adhaerens]|uniref:ABC transporter permease n=1 Tax=Hypericibacter adhaerens TaxID=2602016 RepID=UPI002C858C31|nr:ABC transporter permease subunit [Hypericibacter adhaerens]HWA42344.1 ABC transporter permease subunit [Hypericibacter adhaerens]
MNEAMPESATTVSNLALRVAVVACLVLLLLGFTSVLWTPYPVGSLDVAAAVQGPTPAHWLGTDQLGHDVLSLLMKGLLTSFVVAMVSVALGALVGLPLGLAAARWRRALVLPVAALSEFLAAFPALLLAALLGTALEPGAATVMIAVGIAAVPPFAAAARDAALNAGRLGYVDAARLSGTTGWELVRRHMLYDLVRLVLSRALSLMGVAVLAEAALSYVGLGLQPPATSLGLLLRDAQTYAGLAPGLLLAPGLALTLIALALGLAGYALRLTVEPALRAEGPDGAA